MRKREEYQTQVAIVEFFRLQYPKHLIFHIPNGEQRSPAVGAKLKRMGVIRGVLDLFIPSPKKGKNGMFMEVKSNAGKISKEQLTFIDHLIEQGYAVAIVNNIDAAQTAIRTYMD